MVVEILQNKFGTVFPVECKLLMFCIEYFVSESRSCKGKGGGS